MSDVEPTYESLFSRTMLATAEVREDRQIHVSALVGPEGLDLVEIRDFIPSTGVYGRGVTFPASAGPGVVAAVAAIGAPR